MVKHICDKEKELAEIQTDTKWIKKELIELSVKVDMMYNVLTAGEGKISKLNRTVYGNGKKGLAEICYADHEYIVQKQAQLNLILFMAVFLGLSNIFMIIKILSKNWPF